MLLYRLYIYRDYNYIVIYSKVYIKLMYNKTKALVYCTSRWAHLLKSKFNGKWNAF